MALIRRDYGTFSVGWTEEAAARREDVLERGAMVGAVTNPEQLAALVDAQIAIKSLLKDVEEARKEVKGPVEKFGQAIDKGARAFRKTLEEEYERLCALARDYEAVKAQQRRAAEILARREVEELERKRQEQLQKAETVEQIDEIQAAHNEAVAAAQPPVIQDERPKGQIIKTDWHFTITNMRALWDAYPACVLVEPRRSEIKALLDAGITPPGVEARKIINPTVRLPQDRGVALPIVK